jgi:dipeptidyl aminopeptidase/acylaminoacyl peptidase
MRCVRKYSRALSLAGILVLTAAVQAEPPPELREEAVRFASGEVSIAGVVVSPVGEGPHPAIVLIDGSGETDRRNMRDFSVALAQAGFVTLAYDKRGVGESTGDADAWYYFSIDDLAADAAAGVDFLAQRDEVAKDRIGLLGISQGGWVAPLAATLTDSASFMVLRSAAATTIGEDRLFERAARLTDEGFSANEVAESREMQELYQAFIRTGQGFEQFEKAWHENANKRWFPRVYQSDALLNREHRYHQWYATVLEFDPLPHLGDLSIPVLWLFGDPEHDRLAPVAASVERVGALQQQGKDYTIHVFKDTDHNIMPIDDPNAVPPYVESLLQWLEPFTQP